MPKVVDHNERRTRIAEALLRVAGERGLQAVSLRHVATEAGVTSGMVQHYFRTKDEMMTFAMEVVRERNEARLNAVVADLGPEPAPRDLLRAFVAGVLPLDEARRADGRVALAFLAYTAVRPEAAAPLRADTSAMLGFVADLIRAGRPRAGIDPEAAAVGLLALMEGLGVHLLGDHYGPQAALAALDGYLNTIFD